MLNNNFSVIGVAITPLQRVRTKNSSNDRFEFVLEMTTRHATNTIQITVVPGIVINKVPDNINGKQIMVSGYLDSKRYTNENKELYFNKIIATEIVVLSEEKIDQPLTFKETYQDED